MPRKITIPTIEILIDWYEGSSGRPKFFTKVRAEQGRYSCGVLAFESIYDLLVLRDAIDKFLYENNIGRTE